MENRFALTSHKTIPNEKISTFSSYFIIFIISGAIQSVMMEKKEIQKKKKLKKVKKLRKRKNFKKKIPLKDS